MSQESILDKMLQDPDFQPSERVRAALDSADGLPLEDAIIRVREHLTIAASLLLERYMDVSSHAELNRTLVAISAFQRTSNLFFGNNGVCHGLLPAIKERLKGSGPA